MNTPTSILLALAIMMPASLCAADQIRIETKIIVSEGIKIPHNLIELGKLKGVSMLSAPSFTTKSSQNAKVEIIKEYQPVSVTKEKFDTVNTGITLYIKPEQQGKNITFTGSLTISKLVGEGKRGEQSQSEIVTRTIHFSGIQKAGQEGWFDLVDPINLGQEEWIDIDKSKPTNVALRKKITVWIRLEQNNAEATP